MCRTYNNIREIELESKKEKKRNMYFYTIMTCAPGTKANIYGEKTVAYISIKITFTVGVEYEILLMYIMLTS